MTVILGKNSKTAIYLRRRKRGEVLSVSRKCLLDKYLASLEVFLRKKRWHGFMLMNVLLLIKSEPV